MTTIHLLSLSASILRYFHHWLLTKRPLNNFNNSTTKPFIKPPYFSFTYKILYQSNHLNVKLGYSSHPFKNRHVRRAILSRSLPNKQFKIIYSPSSRTEVIYNQFPWLLKAWINVMHVTWKLSKLLYEGTKISWLRVFRLFF